MSVSRDAPFLLVMLEPRSLRLQLLQPIDLRPGGFTKLNQFQLELLAGFDRIALVLVTGIGDVAMSSFSIFA